MENDNMIAFFYGVPDGATEVEEAKLSSTAGNTWKSYDPVAGITFDIAEAAAVDEDDGVNDDSVGSCNGNDCC